MSSPASERTRKRSKNGMDDNTVTIHGNAFFYQGGGGEMETRNWIYPEKKLTLPFLKTVYTVKDQFLQPSAARGICHFCSRLGVTPPHPMYDGNRESVTLPPPIGLE
jgi:hypothetical protein